MSNSIGNTENLNGEDRPKIGVALSGGATRGVAHIGALKALHDLEVYPSMLSGTSIGALVAALYAFDVPIEEIQQKAMSLSWWQISSLSFSKSGLLSNKEIGELVREFIGDANIEDARIPLAIVTTDIGSGDQVILREGNVAQSVMASTCLPGIFKPVAVDGRLLVDGFLLENIPLSPLKPMGAEIIIGVNLGRLREYREPDGIIDILINAFEIAVDANMSLKIDAADLLISPQLESTILTDPEIAESYYKYGYAETLRNGPAIRELLHDWSRKRPTFIGRLLTKLGWSHAAL